MHMNGGDSVPTPRFRSRVQPSAMSKRGPKEAKGSQRAYAHNFQDAAELSKVIVSAIVVLGVEDVASTNTQYSWSAWSARSCDYVCQGTDKEHTYQLRDTQGSVKELDVRVCTAFR